MTLMEMAQLLGNFGEFVGAITVVITLIYLATQVSQGKDALDANTRAVKASLSYQAAIKGTEFYAQLLETPELLNLMTKSQRRNPPEFTQEEESRLYISNRLIMERTDALYYLHKHALVDEEYWIARVEWTRRWLARPYVASWWERERDTSNYSPSFIAMLSQKELRGKI